jgi:hypothetical protein
LTRRILESREQYLQSRPRLLIRSFGSDLTGYSEHCTVPSGRTYNDCKIANERFDAHQALERCPYRMPSCSPGRSRILSRHGSCPVLYKFAPTRSASSVPSLAGDFVARPSWTGCAQRNFRPHCSRGAGSAFVRQEYITRQSRVAVLSLRLQGCAGASRLGERAAGSVRVGNKRSQPCCRRWYSRYLARVVKRILEDLKTFVQNPRGLRLCARVVGETRSSG